MTGSAAGHAAPLAASAGPEHASIDPATSIGAVALTVSELGRARTFYERVLGLCPAPADGGGRRSSSGLALSDAAGGPPLVVLHEDPAAPPFDPNGTGLFHLALLVPNRLELARSLQRIARARWPLTGASDHLVSEALYLRDPDGNGIEVYADRPRADWTSDENGAPRMATLPLDLQDVSSELARAGVVGERDAGLAAGTRIGHIHLQVSQLAAAERFYGDLLGFDVTVRTYPGALFLSAGGYHHHIGLNTWQSLGAAPVRPGGVGLRHFEVILPGDDALRAVLDRVDAAGVARTEPNAVAVEPNGVSGAASATLVRDPSGIAVLLRRS